MMMRVAQESLLVLATSSLLLASVDATSVKMD